MSEDIRGYQSKYTDVFGNEVSISVNNMSASGLISIIEERLGEEPVAMIIPLEEAINLAWFIGNEAKIKEKKE